MTVYNQTNDYIQIVTKRFSLMLAPREISPVNAKRIRKKDIALLKKKGVHIVRENNRKR